MITIIKIIIIIIKKSFNRNSIFINSINKNWVYKNSSNKICANKNYLKVLGRVYARSRKIINKKLETSI